MKEVIGKILSWPQFQNQREGQLILILLTIPSLFTLQPFTLPPLLLTFLHHSYAHKACLLFQTIALLYQQQYYLLLPYLLFSFTPLPALALSIYLTHDFQILLLCCELLCVRFFLGYNFMREAGRLGDLLDRMNRMGKTDEPLVLVEVTGSRTTRVVEVNGMGNALLKSIKNKNDIQEVVVERQKGLLWDLINRVIKTKKSDRKNLLVRERLKGEATEYLVVGHEVEGMVLLRFHNNRENFKKQQSISKFLDYLCEIIFLVNTSLLDQYKQAINEKVLKEKLAQLAYQNHYVELVGKQLQDLLCQHEEFNLCKTSFKLRAIVSQSIDMLMNRFRSTIMNFLLEMDDPQIELFGNYQRLQYMIQLLVNVVVDVHKGYSLKPSFTLRIKTGLSAIEGHEIKFQLEWERIRICLNDFESYFRLFDLKKDWDGISRMPAKEIGVIGLTSRLHRQSHPFTLHRSQNGNFILLRFEWFFKHPEQAYAVKNKRLNIDFDFTPRVAHERSRNFQLSNKSLHSSILYDPSQVLSPFVNFIRNGRGIFQWKERLEPRDKPIPKQDEVPEDIKMKIEHLVNQDIDRIIERLQPDYKEESVKYERSIIESEHPSKISSRRKVNWRIWKPKD